MNPYRIHLLLIALLVCTMSAPVRAQDVNDALRRAAALEAGGKPDEAIERYEALYRENPGRTDILFRLEALLVRQGRYPEAADLLKARLRAAPHDINARLSLGGVLLEMDQQAEAAKQLDQVLKGATNPGPYALVANLYQQHDFLPQAAETYRRARTDLHSPRLFARELAELAESQGHYPEAVSEYLLLLDENPRNLLLIESRFREFARADTAAPRTLALLADEVHAHPHDSNHARLLTEYAIASGHVGPALTALSQPPALTAQRQALVFRIANATLQAGKDSTAAHAFQILLDGGVSPQLLPASLLGLARAREKSGLIEQAENRYRDLIDRFPDRTETDEARVRLGRLLAPRDPEAALRVYRTLVDTGRLGPWRYQALFDMADLLVRMDRIAAADSACARIVRERPGQEEVGEAQFRLAEYHFFAGDIQNAQKRLAELLSGPPTSYALNDALALSVLLQQGQENPDALKAYAVAQKLKRQEKPDAALKVLQNLLGKYPDLAFKDRVLSDQAGLLDALGRYPDAIRTCHRLLSEVPWSPLCPGALMTLAHIYEDRLGQLADARKTYETLLANYPRSMEADAARDRLRVLLNKFQKSGTSKETG